MLFISVFFGLNHDADYTIRRKLYFVLFAANSIFIVSGFYFCEDGHGFYCCDNVYK